MSIRESLQSFYLCWLSHPKCDRELYRCIQRTGARSIVELGMGSIDRALRLIDYAKRVSGADADVKYACVDLFDARAESAPKLKLKDAHCRLACSGATVRLVPGDVFSGLSRCANQLVGTDLLLIGPGADPELLTRAWIYVPRMLSASSVVFEASGANGLRQLSADDLALRAQSKTSATRAA